MTPTAPPYPRDDMAGPSRTSKHRLRKLRLLIPMALVIAIGGGLAIQFLQSPADDAIHLSGRIEGYETDVGAKVGGRIEFIKVREGDRVTQGQVIAQLDDVELQAELAGAEARVAAAQQQVSQARLQIAVIESQIQEAQLTLLQSEDDTTGRINAAKASVATAQAQLAQAQAQAKQMQAELRLAQADRDRFATLVKDGAVTQQRFEQAQTQFDSTRETLQARQAAVAAARRQVDAAQGNLTQATTSRLNPDIRTAQLKRLQTQLTQAKAQIAAARAEVDNAKAKRKEIKARLEDLEITSPIDGVVLTRTTEPGEVIATGTTVLTVVNLNDVYLRGYIPEGQVGKVRLGQAARVFLDSDPDRPLKATVIAVDPEASFTPENIYFRDDRVTQVFGLKLGLDNAQGFAKPGMPADGEIITVMAED